MKRLHFSMRPTLILTIAIAASVGGLLTLPLRAAQDNSQRTFSSPEDAIKALREASESRDKTALQQIFGPDVKLLRTGDEVQDANNEAKFAKAMTENCQQVPDADGKITLEIGASKWPFPIPLVKTNSEWVFDTAAGREEIIDRHIGRDELNAIGVCSAYVDAQRRYASMDADGSGTTKYALKFKSSDGKKDGLYWPAASGETPSPFGQLVAEAHVEGYGSKEGTGHHPFHGYFFKILTRQGKEAPGGRMRYTSHGNLTKGFALVAWPEHWDQSGVMTFMVNQDGTIYQRNLGQKTDEIARAMKDYNPDSNWTVVQDKGMIEE